jgi:hypothetical protein
MDTLAFFQSILPADGTFYIVLLDQGKPRHIACNSHAELAQVIDKYRDNEQVAVYHACAAYRDPYVEVDGKKRWRIAENWSRAQSFWMDIDCAPEKAEAETGYTDKAAGWAATQIFCKKAGLPLPMVVDSGNGLHCYWPLTKPVTPQTWRKIANALKMLTVATGFLADPSRTADFASILRPVGTINRKGEPREVKVKRECHRIAPEDFAQAIRVAVDKFCESTPKPSSSASINDDLIAHVPDTLESSAVLAASKCQQIAEMRDSKGDIGYEHWRGVIGVIKHCTEGKELAIQWSERRAETGHTQTDAGAKYESWSSPPTTCEFLSRHNPTGCDGCPYKGKVKSPIVLGRVIPEQAAQEAEVTVDGERMKVQVPEPPEGYGYVASGTTRYLTDKDGIVHSFVFTPVMLYATHRTVNEIGSYGLALRAHLPRGKIREFVVPTSTLASTTELTKLLADKEVTTSQTKDASMHLTAYLKDSLGKLMAEADEINTLTSFGWHYDMEAFLLGDRLYHRDGSVRKVLVGGFAADIVNRAFNRPAAATVDGYARPLNEIYARPGMEPYQYAICSGFGSVLSAFGEENYCGLMLALIGETGKGKTSVGKAALYAWGEPTHMTIAGDGSVGSTENARWATLGAFQNLPVMFDETTKMSPEDLSRIAYTVSLGLEKKRMNSTQSGLRMATQHTWRMSPIITANNDIHMALNSLVANSGAEAVRVVQIHTDKFDIPQLAEAEVPSALEQMRHNRGAAGEAFIRHVVTNIEETYEAWRANMVEVTKHIRGSEYRLYRNHAACTLTALQITNHLGITDFDYDTIFNFAVKLMQNLSDEVKENSKSTPKESFNRMVNELVPRIIRTQEYRDGRDKAGPERTERVHGAIAGRYINSTATLYLVRKDFRDWCAKNRVEPDGIETFIKEQGAWVEVPPKFTLTRGTDQPIMQQRCVGVDLAKLNDIMLDGPKLVDTTAPQKTPPTSTKPAAKTRSAKSV